MKHSMVLNGITTVLWEKWIEFKYEWVKITAAALVSPMLYMIALGWGLGSTSTVTDRPYIDFLVPGIIALNTMNASFSAVGQSLNVQRIFEHSFDQIIISPTPMSSYILGQMLGGAIRGMYGGCLLLIISIPFGATMKLSPAFFLIMLLNGMTFAALGILAAIVAKTHGDIARFSTFCITPMTFLCNTFFPIERVPDVIEAIINILPLTHASGALRSLAYGESLNLVNAAVLAIYACVFMVSANIVITKRKNL